MEDLPGQFGDGGDITPSDLSNLDMDIQYDFVDVPDSSNDIGRD